MDIHRSSYEMERQRSAMNNFPGFSPHRGMVTSPHSAYSNASDYNTPSTLLARRYSYINPHRPWYRRLYKSLQICTKKFMESHTRKGVKYINANKHVLSTYHNSFLYGEFPVFVGIRAAMRTGTIGHIWTTVEFFLAALSGILHVYSTYHLKNIEDYEWILQAQNVASCIFVADYVLRLYWC